MAREKAKPSGVVGLAELHKIGEMIQSVQDSIQELIVPALVGCLVVGVCLDACAFVIGRRERVMTNGDVLRRSIARPKFGGIRSIFLPVELSKIMPPPRGRVGSPFDPLPNDLVQSTIGPSALREAKNKAIRERDTGFEPVTFGLGSRRSTN